MPYWLQEIISRGELIGLVNDVIGKHQDLMVRCRKGWDRGRGKSRRAGSSGMVDTYGRGKAKGLVRT